MKLEMGDKIKFKTSAIIANKFRELAKWAREPPLKSKEGQRRMEILFQAVLEERRKIDPDFRPMTGLDLIKRTSR